jgi:hypothetical protein
MPVREDQAGFDPGTAGALAAGVLALGAALAAPGELVESLPDVLDLELIEPLVSQVRADVQPRKHLVFLIGFRCEIGLITSRSQ